MYVVYCMWWLVITGNVAAEKEECEKEEYDKVEEEEYEMEDEEEKEKYEMEEKEEENDQRKRGGEGKPQYLTGG